MTLRQAKLGMILAGLLAVAGCNTAAQQTADHQTEAEAGSNRHSWHRLL